MNEIVELIKRMAEDKKAWESIIENEKLRDPVRLCGRFNSFHVYKGIEKLADNFHAEIKSQVINYNDGSSRVERWFEYNGLTVFQLDEVESYE